MTTSLSNLLALLSLDETGYVKGQRRAYKASQTFGEKLTSTFNKMGGAVVAGLGVAGAAAAGFLVSSIEPASDLEETVSKIGVVFDEQGDAMLEWANKSATAFGMSKNQALGAAGTYGNLFRAMGIGVSTSAEMSSSLVELAADLASFNNMDPTEVLDKLRAGISGETEPLKTLGVNLNQAQIQAKALEMGLVEMVDGTAGPLTVAAKTQAAYALIMEQTALAQGDFARTSGGLANQQRILKAQFEDLRAKLGGALLPVITRLATTINEYLARPETTAAIESMTVALGNFATRAVAMIPRVIEGIQRLFGWLQENRGVVVGIFGVLAVAAVAWAVTTAAAAWTAMAPFLPIIAVIAAIGAAIYLLYEAWNNNWGGIRDTLTNLWAGTLQPIFNTLRDWLSKAIPAYLAALRDAWTNVLLPALQAAWAFLQNFVFPILGAVANVIGAVLGVVIRAVAGYIQNVWLPQFRILVALFKAHVLPIIQKVASWLATKLAPAFRGVADWIGRVVDAANRFADRIRNIQLPAWLTPGSPTPLETGLVGIQAALDGIARASLPRFEGAISLAAPGGPIGGVSAATPAAAGGANQALLVEVRDLMRDLPRAIAKATRDDRLRRAR